MIKYKLILLLYSIFLVANFSYSADLGLDIFIFESKFVEDDNNVNREYIGLVVARQENCVVKIHSYDSKKALPFSFKKKLFFEGSYVITSKFIKTVPGLCYTTHNSIENYEKWESKTIENNENQIVISKKINLSTMYTEITIISFEKNK